MHPTFFPRLPAFAAGAFVAAILGSGLPLPARAATFPPLNEPATQESHPGKFVWAELFTGDSAAKS